LPRARLKYKLRNNLVAHCAEREANANFALPQTI
jgi:hypothetical protein